MPLYKTEGIVLHQFDLGEADRIITYYTRNNGKVKVVAKGVRRTRSSLTGATQLFTYSDLLLYSGRARTQSLGRLSQTEIKESFSKLREDLFKMAYGTYILDLVKETTFEDDPNEGIFLLLLKTLLLLVQEEDLEMITRIFELRLMRLLGFQPFLDCCQQCSEPIRENKIQFHPGAGGLVCAECSKKNSGSTITISRGTVEIMKHLLNSNYRQLQKLKISEYARKELEAVNEPFIQYHLDHRLKSLDFLKSIIKMGK